MSKVVQQVLALIILSLIFYVLERKSKRVTHFKKDKQSLKLDTIYWFINPIFMAPLIKVVSQFSILILLFLFGMEEIRHTGGEGFGPILNLPVPLQVFFSLLAIDFIQYWVHRWMHFNKKLWKIHAIHHSSEHLDWLGSLRIHPLNPIINRTIMGGCLLCLGFPLKVVGSSIPFFGFFGLLLHAHLNWSFGPFRYLIASPVFHRWHHTSEDDGIDKNFAGLFPIFDILFGTFHMPEGKVATYFGLRNEMAPNTLWGQLKYPFIK